MKALWVQMIDLYLNLQGTLSWQTNNIGRNEKVMKIDWYHLHSSHKHLKTNWNITIYMCALTATMIRLHLIWSWWAWPVPPEFNCVQQASISYRVSMSTFARWQYRYILLLPVRGRHCDVERAIHSALPYISSFFLFSFLMIDRRTIISESTGPNFAIFSLNKSVLSADDRSGPLFAISQGTLPWRPIFRKNGKLPSIVTLAFWNGMMYRYVRRLPTSTHRRDREPKASLQCQETQLPNWPMVY